MKLDRESILRKRRAREKIKKKKEKEEAKKRLEQEEKPKKQREDSHQPYDWRRCLKSKDILEPSPASAPKESTTKKHTRSPVQKMLRTSPSSKPRKSPSTPVDPKWTSISSRRRSPNYSTNRRSNTARITQESAQKPMATKAAASEDSDDSSSGSDDSLIAHIEERRKRRKESRGRNSQGSVKTAKKSTRENSMDTSASSSEEEGGRCSHASCKSSRKKNLRSCCGDGDSDSEDDSDSDSRRANKQKSLWSNDKRTGNGISFSSGEEVDEYSSEDSDRTTSGRKSSKGKSAQKRRHDSDSDSSSEEVSSSRRGRKSGKNSGRRSRNSGGHDDSSSSDEEKKRGSRRLFANSSDEIEPKKATKPVRNPHTLEREEQLTFEAIAGNCDPQADEGDGLWDMKDGDGGQETEKSKAKERKNRGRSKSKKSTRDSNKSSFVSSSPSKKAGMSYWYLPENDDKHDIMKLLKKEDEEALESIIHPELENPEWSFDYKPLELGGGTVPKVSVPASLSRYLAQYQKEGIQFMYDCLARKSGAVMGDDMGLGKTLQVISLLCALFEKTGTGLDWLRIHRREKLINEQREKAIREEKEANLDGRIYMPKKLDMKSLDLPLCYPVLIVVPPTVVENWEYEFERFSNFAIAVFSGEPADRNLALDRIRNGRAEVLIAAKSFFQLKNSFKHLNEISWNLVVIDEFHTFKNEKSQIACNLRQLKADHEPLVLGMTGTLMQNDHKELWNLIDLVETKYLGTWKDFEESTARAIKHGRRKGADEQTIAASKRKSQALEQQLARLFISRKKEIVLADKLTTKTVNVVFCKPSELQKRVYAHILTLPDVQHVKMATSPCDCGVNQHIFKKFYKLKSQAERVRYIRENQQIIMKRWECCYTVPINPRRDEVGQPLIDPDAVIWRMLDGHDETNDNGCSRCPYCVLFAVLDKLNKLSSHVGSLLADRNNIGLRGSPEHVRFVKELEFAKVAFPPDVVQKLPDSYYRKDASFNDHFELSGKMKKLHKLLKRFKKDGCKVLVFSYSTRTLDFIQEYVKSEGHNYLRIDGKVKPKDRQSLCNQFNKDRNKFLFLLSTKACGLGLNLTAANKVIIFDVEWNPSWDEQAQDRAYRIGQKKDVEVIRLVTEGTIDELRYLRQLYKVQLKNETLNSSEAKARSARVFRGIQGDKHRKGELFGTENLLKLKEDGSFLSDLWKSKRPNSKSDGSKEVGVHNPEEIASNLNSDLCDQLFVSGDAENAAIVESQRDSAVYDSEDDVEKMHPPPRRLHGNNQDVNKKMTTLRRNEQEQIRHRSSNEISERDGDNTVYDDESVDPMIEGDEEDSETGDSNRDLPPANANAKIERNDGNHMDNAVNQDALYDEQQGGALYEEGDDGYDEEMGGETQNAYASYANMQLPENPQDAAFDDDDDDESGDHNHDPNFAGFFHEADEEAAATRSARRGEVGVPQQREADMAPDVAQIREALRQVEDGAEIEASVRRASSASNGTQQRREVDQEGVSIGRTSESRISVQLRPELVDPSKEDFFRSRDARGSVDCDEDGVEGLGRAAKKSKTSRDDSGEDSDASERRLAKKPKIDSGDSDVSAKKQSAKKSTKEKKPIRLFGKTITSSKSNSKGNSSGLCLPTYNKRKKKK